MDFTLNEELAELQGLSRRIFAARADHRRLRAVEAGEDRIDEALWRELAAAGLLGVALPEDAGGAGLGLGAVCVLLEEQGRRVAPVPLWPTLVAALTLAEHGAPDQRAELLPGVVDGSRRLTVALEEFGVLDAAEPACAAAPDDTADGGWRLTGVKAAVPGVAGAAHVLVSATGPDGAGLFLTAADAPGVTWERTETTDRAMAGNLTLEAAPARPLGPGALPWTLDVARTALAALQLGVASGALDITASYLRERRQFGRPLGAFQAVQHQLADCYIEIEAMRVCLWRAVCAVDDGDRAGEAALVAKWWADEGGLNVVHRTQHLHGGIGVDVDYPVHRYFLWGKQISGTLGGASADLQRLGDLIAEEAAS
ncbi:acyl-CoA dehydrogenase family protein [Thermomonospora catenispora]|uniref:acyl-CoA dehydrogenase family protein n=1 Tax=Thermomonospora catenispora TaxID=2493090 RepID=UPI0011223B1E|nr:acyl-CoA dehydrogenase family protein [Thermomonospora catenispora]TNY34914.1 acyl-CoA dehydrogenase [Thermomonospora catenispora]